MATVVSDCAPFFLVMLTVGFTVAVGAVKAPGRACVPAARPDRVVNGAVVCRVGPAAAAPSPVSPAPRTRDAAATDASSRTGRRMLIPPPLPVFESRAPTLSDGLGKRIRARN